MATILDEIKHIIIALQEKEIRDNDFWYCCLCNAKVGHKPDCIWLKARLMVEHGFL